MALENYAEEDRRIYKAIREVYNYKIFDKYKGEVTTVERFLNIPNGAVRISGALIERPYFGIMDERRIASYPTE